MSECVFDTQSGCSLYTHITPQGDYMCDDHGWGDRAAVALVIRYDRVLALDGPRGWVLPGGKVDKGENDWEAVVREVKEETNLDLDDPLPIFSWSSAMDHGRLVTVFVGRVDNLEAIKGNGREGDPQWIEPSLLITQSKYSEYNKRLLSKFRLTPHKPSLMIG